MTVYKSRILNFDTQPNSIHVEYISIPFTTVLAPPEHLHNRYEIFLVLEGFCTFFIQNVFFHMGVGDICIIPPNCIHAMAPTSCHKHLFINFSDFYVDKSITSDLNKIIIEGKYTPKLEDLDFFKQTFESIYENADKINKYNSLYLKTYFDRLFIKILSTKEQFNSEIRTDTISRDIVNVLKYIRYNYKDDITMNQMAESCHLTPPYFSKIFKEMIGMGFKEYLIFTRLTVAETLLRKTSCKICEVASESGFNDSNYFSTVFNKRFKTPPLKYRKKHAIKHN